MDGPFVAYVLGIERNPTARVVLEALRPHVDRIVQLRSLGHFRASTVRALIIYFGDTSQIDGLVTFASRNGDAAYLAYVADDIPSADLRRLLATGNGEWLPSSTAPSEIADLCERLLGRSPRDRNNPTERATLVSFVPAGGGVGNTTIALETALTHASRRKSGPNPATCLLDLSGPLGNACDLIDLHPNLDLSVIADSPRQLDVTMLESFRSRSPYGLDVYAPAKYATEPTGPLEPALHALLDLLSQVYDRIHIDHGTDLCDARHYVVGRSDVVFVTTDFSVPAARRVAAIKARLGVLTTERQAVVINRYAGRAKAGLSRADFERGTACLRFLTVSSADSFARECANVGVPMSISNSRHKLCRDIQAIENFISPVVAAQPSRLRRLLLRRRDQAYVEA